MVYERQRIEKVNEGISGDNAFVARARPLGKTRRHRADAHETSQAYVQVAPRAFERRRLRFGARHRIAYRIGIWAKQV